MQPEIPHSLEDEQATATTVLPRVRAHMGRTRESLIHMGSRVRLLRWLGGFGQRLLDRAQRHPRVALVLVVVLFVLSVVFRGLHLDRNHVFFWLLLGLMSVSLTDFKRWAVGVFSDWSPLFFILYAYGWLRGRADNFASTAHVLPQIRFDRVIFHGDVATTALQSRFFHADSPRWYDYVALTVYMSHFFLSFVVAAVLWKVAYPRFRQYIRMFVLLTMLGFITYLFFPAVPPWLASERGMLPPIARVIHAMWQYINVQTAANIFSGHNNDSNTVAAMPSLHAAYPFLLLLFFWRDGWLARLVLIPYVLLMATTLMYSGEHYLLDIVIGWTYAIFVFTLCLWLERRYADQKIVFPGHFKRRLMRVIRPLGGQAARSR